MPSRIREFREKYQLNGNEQPSNYFVPLLAVALPLPLVIFPVTDVHAGLGCTTMAKHQKEVDHGRYGRRSRNQSTTRGKGKGKIQGIAAGRREDQGRESTAYTETQTRGGSALVPPGIHFSAS